MSVLFGRRLERRDAFPEPPIPPNSAAAQGTYNRVDLSRAESSLQKVAVWASTQLLAGTVAMLPIDIYSGTGVDQRERPKPTWMLDPAGDGYGLEDWLSQLMMSWLLRGNVYGLVGSRDTRLGTPTQIVLQHPDQVAGWRDRDGKTQWRVAGKPLDPPDMMWHRRVHPVPGCLLGLSPTAYQATTIGTGIAAMRFGAEWFAGGAHPTGVLSTDKDLDQTRAMTAKQRYMAALEGRREPVVLGGGWKFESIQIAPNESQFLETNEYTSAECCRIFGPGVAEILGYKTGGSLTYQNVEQRALHLLTYTLDPWLTRIERIFTSLLPRPQYAKVNRGALLRTDLLTRYRAHEIAIRNRFQTPNEARELEDNPPLTDEQIAEFAALPAVGAPAPTKTEE